MFADVSAARPRLREHRRRVGRGTATGWGGNAISLKTLRSTAFVFMVSGLVIVGVGDVGGAWVQLLGSAGAASCRLFSYSLACMRAHNNAVSSLAACAVVKLLITFSMLAGMAIGGSGIVPDGFALMAVLTLAVTLLSTLLSPFDVDDCLIIEQTFQFRGERPVEELLDRISLDRGLSRREATVFMLMTQGMAASEISERLFISKSAVRAHQSRVYAKFGVHNQQELTDLMKTELSGATRR